MKKPPLPLALTVLLVLVSGACSRAASATEPPASTQQPPTLTAASPTREIAPTDSPAPAEPYHSLATRTGIEELDRILAAVESGDVSALRSLVLFTDTLCTRLEGLGGPPKCREGEAEGTAVQALPFLGSEGSFIRSAEIENWRGIEAAGLYAIYEVSPDIFVEEYYPAGEYAILFVGPENQPPVALRVQDGGIVRVDHYPGASIRDLDGILEREAASIILAPPRP